MTIASAEKRCQFLRVMRENRVLSTREPWLTREFLSFQEAWRNERTLSEHAGFPHATFASLQNSNSMPRWMLLEDKILFPWAAPHPRRGRLIPCLLFSLRRLSFRCSAPKT